MNKITDNKIVNFLMNVNIKRKYLYAGVLILILADAILLSVKFSKQKVSSFLFAIDENYENAAALECFDSASSNKTLSVNSYGFYKFTEDQKNEIASVYKKYGSEAFTCAVEIPVNMKSRRYREKFMLYERPVYFGFIYESDLDKKGKITNDLKGRGLSCTDLRFFAKDLTSKTVIRFETGLTIEKNLRPADLPCGFFVYTPVSMKILYAQAKKPVVGFDLTGNIPLYVTAPTGGLFTAVPEYFDFTGASMVFPVHNSLYSLMPAVLVAAGDAFSEDCEITSRSEISCDGEVFSIYKNPDGTGFRFLTSGLKNPFGNFEFSKKALSMKKLIMVLQDEECLEKTKETYVPLKTDPGLIPGFSGDNWRNPDYELYEWDRFPGILFFDTKDYDVQGRFFTRLAFFVEKAGFRGKLLTNEQLDGLHGYNAHDYSAESLSRFFNEALRKRFVLNDEEILLSKILEKNGVIVWNGTEYTPGKGAVISISQESKPWLRQSLCAHEIWHGLFFTDEDFRNTTAAVYYTIDDNSRDFLKAYWNSQPGLSYDQSDEYLMHNEFMAYILQQPLNDVASYFIHLSGRGSVKKALPELCDYVINSNGQTFEDAAKIFDSYINDRWGLGCGRVSLIVRK